MIRKNIKKLFDKLIIKSKQSNEKLLLYGFLILEKIIYKKKSIYFQYLCIGNKHKNNIKAKITNFSSNIIIKIICRVIKRILFEGFSKIQLFSEETKKQLSSVNSGIKILQRSFLKRHFKNMKCSINYASIIKGVRSIDIAFNSMRKSISRSIMENLKNYTEYILIIEQGLQGIADVLKPNIKSLRKDIFQSIKKTEKKKLTEKEQTLGKNSKLLGIILFKTFQKISNNRKTHFFSAILSGIRLIKNN